MNLILQIEKKKKKYSNKLITLRYKKSTTFLLFRLSLITVYNILQKDFTDDVKELLKTLIEICELAYAGADKRSP